MNSILIKSFFYINLLNTNDLKVLDHQIGTYNGVFKGISIPDLIYPECPGEEMKAREAYVFILGALASAKTIMVKRDYEINKNVYSIDVFLDGKSLKSALISNDIASKNINRNWCLTI